jgi:glyoxylase-like metal-dependent hydrolase (beta-lactamase superfamily II)
MQYISNWLKVRKMDGNVWAIDDNGQDTMYLVEGKTKALLIDTGLGIGDLPELVASLTSLPVIVVNTHGHPDHVGGNYQFENTHIVREDIPMLHGCFTRQARNWLLKNVLRCTPFPEPFREFWLAQKPKSIITIQPGHIFDLGGRLIQVIAVPGHTRGCIGLLDETERLLFTGDSILAGDIWLHLRESLPLNIFLESVNRLNLLTDKFDQILPAHSASPLPKAIISQLSEGITAILEGRLRGKPHRTFAGDGLVCNFGECGIVYRAKT